MPAYQGRFIDSLADRCESMVCFLHTPRIDEIPLMDYELKSSNVTLIGLGEHTSIPKRLIAEGKMVKAVKNSCNLIDAFLIRGPSPFLPVIARVCHPLPLILLLGADSLAGIEDLPQPFWRKEIIRAFWTLNQKRQVSIAKRSLTFVNSHLLFTKYQEIIPNLIETKTTTLSSRDFSYRQDTCQRKPYHILYAGRIDRTKGILDILEAVAILAHEGENIIFDLVGPLERNDRVIDLLFDRARDQKIKNQIQYHGYQSLGNSLFSFYKQADIFINASQGSEGFPRTIWEAFSQGTPVIATNVGSIPSYLKHEKDALIVEPHSPRAIADQIRRLIYEPELRQGLIRHGYTLAEENTLDKRAKEMISNIEKWLDTKPERS